MDSNIWLGIIIAVCFIVGAVFARWSRKRKTEQKADALEQLAQQAGVRPAVGANAELPRGLGPEHAPQSTGETAALTALGGAATMAEAGDATLTYSMRLQRGQWAVRVAQAQWNKAAWQPTGAGAPVHKELVSHFSLEIKLPTTQYMELRFTDLSDRAKKQLSPLFRIDTPAQLAQRPDLWRDVAPPEHYESFVSARASDQNFGALVVNPTAVEWMKHNSALWGRWLNVTIEPGTLVVTCIEPTPEQVLPMVDLFVGFLDRIPAQAWYGPPGATPQTEGHINQS